MTPCIFIQCAIPEESLYPLLTDGARYAGVQRALPIRVGVFHTLLTGRVVGVLAAIQHPLTAGTHSARLALAIQVVHEVAVVALARSVVRVGAGGLHAHETCALSTRLTCLCVTERFRECLTWKEKKREIIRMTR